MKRASILLCAATLVSAALSSMTYYALELRGGSRIFSIDAPVRKGRLLLFHRYPDRVYMSVPAAEVERVGASEEAPKPEGFAPGQTLFIGPPVEGPSFEASKPVSASPPEAPMDSGYGYLGLGWGGYGPSPHPMPPPRAPSRIGPNGFPIIAPPGTAGSSPLPIGPNGFPILSPQPPR